MTEHPEQPCACDTQDSILRDLARAADIVLIYGNIGMLDTVAGRSALFDLRAKINAAEEVLQDKGVD